jgi:hypothetical protein
MPKTEEIEVDREAYRVYEWREQWLRAGGFSKRNSALLASTAIDYRYAIKLLADAKRNGYDESFVMGLLL